jgi:Ca2+:H+ antiporter
MPINLLLIFIPISLGLNYFGAGPILVFLTAALAVVPLTVLIGEATENISLRLGATLGGLASLTGTLLSNVLLVLGLSIIVGGARFETLRYNVAFASLSAKLLLLAAVGMIVPALFHYTTRRDVGQISTGIAGIAFAAYLANLAFTLVTHKQLFAAKKAEGPIETGRTAWGLGRALGRK